jgi:hypothetical protein
MTEVQAESPRIRINVPDSYKPVDDDEVWADLETYLYQGFLTSSAHILGRTFVLKTINHHELRYVSYLKPMRTAPVDAQELHRASLIAHSVFMVDGENLLPERHRKTRRLVRVVRSLPASAQDSIIESLAALNERASLLRQLVEVFVHENRSRFRWMHIMSSPVHSQANTGVAGTDELGMNYCQQSWTALNRLLDVKEQMERDWTNAKFVGSCFASKGVRSVDEKDKARAAREKSELDDLKMKVLHGYLNRRPGELSEPTATLPDGRRAVVAHHFKADSARELADQMEAALNSEKDHHDLVVEARLREFRERAESIDVSRQRIYHAPVILERGVPVGGSSRVLGGKDEAEALLARLRGLQQTQIAQHHRTIDGRDADMDAESSGNQPDSKGV